MSSFGEFQSEELLSTLAQHDRAVMRQVLLSISRHLQEAADKLVPADQTPANGDRAAEGARKRGRPAKAEQRQTGPAVVPFPQARGDNHEGSDA